MSEGGFFDDLPEPPEPEPIRCYRTPEWLGPPDNVRPATVGLDVIVVESDGLALWASGAQAYREGLLFTLELRLRHAESAEIRGDPFFAEPASGRLRFGLLMADGTRAVAGVHRSTEPPVPPVLMPRGGSGGLGSYRYDFWLWPLPPLGPLTLVLWWPALGIEERRATISTDPIREAAARAVQLWPDERPSLAERWPS